MANSLSCADYLNTLSEPQLCCWVKLNLSYDQIANVWLAENGSPMSKDMQDRHLSHRITSLCDDYNLSSLNTLGSRDLCLSY
jgi:hypothetical protein